MYLNMNHHTCICQHAVAETFRLSTMANPCNSVPPQGVGASQQAPADPLLELLCRAGLEDWHAKFLSFGYESVEDLTAMDVAAMEEIGLKGGHRIRLERVLGKPVKAKVTMEPAVVGVPQCQEEGCKQLAGSKCMDCQKLLYLTHVEEYAKSTPHRSTTVVADIPLCAACKEKRFGFNRRAALIFILFAVAAATGFVFWWSHPIYPMSRDPAQSGDSSTGLSAAFGGPAKSSNSDFWSDSDHSDFWSR